MTLGSLPGALIDVHCHVIPERFPDNPSPATNRRWPCLTHAEGGGVALVIDAKPFRDIDARSWDAARRIEDMDRDGVAIQVLSPLPELLSYWFDEADALVMCDHVNAFIAAMTAHAPDRFLGLGLAPLQAPAAAARYLERIKGEFGLCGVEIGSNINALPLGDPGFDPVWEAAQSLGLAIFVHALHPVGAAAMGADPILTAFAGFPLDTGLAAASMLLAGVTQRFPALRIGFSHGGGALGSLVGRLDKGWEITRGFGGKLLRKPSEHIATMFYDSNVYDPEFLQHLVRHTAPMNVFLGTDYPFALMQTNPEAYLALCDLKPAERESLSHGAARRFLNLE
jgi:aminocarboxymuconate-semialdehyde decarboxylase